MQRVVQQVLMKNLLVGMLAQCLQYHFEVQLIVGMCWICSYALQHAEQAG